MSSISELILAQEHGVVNRLGVGREVEGTLILTNKRVLFVAANTEEEIGPASLGIIYADIDDLNSIKPDPSNLSIPLNSIADVKSNVGIIRTPSLKIRWNYGSGEKNTEFEQTIIGGRKKNLNDWAKVILELKSGKRSISSPASIPGRDTLEGKILYVLGDLQEKGQFEIESQVEKMFNLDLDPDDVQAACDKLASIRLVEKSGDSVMNTYRRISPLGKDDLSS